MKLFYLRMLWQSLMSSMVISAWIIIYSKAKPLSEIAMTLRNRDNKLNGCFKKGKKRKYYVPGTSMMCNDLSTKIVYLLFVLSYFVLLFYFIPLAMSQRRNLKNSEDNREEAWLGLTVRFTSVSGCLRKCTEGFITVHLEKAIKAVSTDRNRSQSLSSRWWVLKE